MILIVIIIIHQHLPHPFLTFYLKVKSVVKLDKELFPGFIGTNRCIHSDPGLFSEFKCDLLFIFTSYIKK